MSSSSITRTMSAAAACSSRRRRPFRPGTLLKFEVKIAADQKVIQGVGRVVWKRDSETQPDVRPAGMGVKFIKIDDASRKVIDTLGRVARRCGAAPTKPAVVMAAIVPAPAAAAAAATPKTLLPATEARKPPNLRKVDDDRFGRDESSESPPAAPRRRPAPEKPAASFFPETKSEAEMPAPEDRTVMKQAAELLQDALREAGGSMAEVGEREAASRPQAGTLGAGARIESADAEPARERARSGQREPKAASESRSAGSAKPSKPRRSSRQRQTGLRQTRGSKPRRPRWP